jgi:hypothetical protein
MSDYLRVRRAAFVLAGVLCGCSGPQDHRPPASAAPPAPAAQTPHSSDETGATKSVAPLMFKVLKEDAATGVAAEIDRIDDTGASHYVVDVDDSGVAQLDKACGSTDRFSAQPKVASYLRASPQPCGPVVTFRLYSAQATYAMLQIADAASKSGDLGKAQAYYGLASDRLRYEQPQQASQAQILASVAAGRLLGVDAGTAPAFANTLRAFQGANHLPITGELDAATQEKLGNVSFAQLSRDAAGVPLDPVGSTAEIKATITEAQIRSVPLSPAAAAQSKEIRNHRFKLHL